jgi:hypothetical protein
MSLENLIANIDVVRSPRDKKVLLARNMEIMSAGIIYVSPVKTVAVGIKEEFTGVPLAGLKNLIAALNIYAFRDKGDALIMGINMVQEWFDIYSWEKRKLTVDDFTEVIKDAGPHEPHMQKLGGGQMSRLEIMQSEAKLARVQSQGFAVPLKTILGSIKR